MGNKVLNNLQVEVKYRVGLSGVEIPEIVLAELEEATDNGHDVSMNDHRYPYLGEWLADTLQERHCYEWKVEVENYNIEED